MFRFHIPKNLYLHINNYDFLYVLDFLVIEKYNTYSSTGCMLLRKIQACVCNPLKSLQTIIKKHLDANIHLFMNSLKKNFPALHIHV